MEYQAAFERLNPDQKKAVTTIDGPVMVIAGPGTGKTQVLAVRIATILQAQDVEPENILALTFTEAAATNMRRRLITLIGPTAYRVNIETFHSYSASLMQQYPEYYPVSMQSQPLTDLERVTMLMSLFDTLPLDALKPRKKHYHHLKNVSKAISDLKREGVSPNRFDELVIAEEELFETEKSELTKAKLTKRQTQLARFKELAQLYHAFQEQLLEQNRYDFDDMIMMTLTALKQHEALRLDQQEQLHYFLVDEYQDTNSAQNQLVRTLADNEFWDRPNLFVVGDPNQSIYRFQGATLENTLQFLDVYPQAEVISLTTGYRCPQPIYDAAHQLMAAHQPPAATKFTQLRDKLSAVTSPAHHHSIQIVETASQTLELAHLADQIESLLATGQPAEEIAVLYQTNYESEAVQELFDQRSIPYDLEGGSAVFDYLEMNQLVSLLRTIHAIQQGQLAGELFEVMRFPWINLPADLVLKAGRISGKTGQDIYEVLSQGYEFFHKHDLGQSVSENEYSQLTNFLQTLQAWADLDLHQTFPTFLECVMHGYTQVPQRDSDDQPVELDRQFSLLRYITDHQLKTELLIAASSLFNFTKNLASAQPGLKLVDFLHRLDTMAEYNLKIAAEDTNAYQGRIKLSTVHKAKGREWDYVFVIHLLDKKWGNKINRNKFPLPEGILEFADAEEADADVRRLLYVAMTRAKKQVTLSYATSWIDQNKSKEMNPSVFVTELRSELPKLLDDQVHNFTPEETNQIMLQSMSPVQTLRPSAEAFINTLLQNFVWSVTALNNYLESSDKFLHQNLLRLPGAKTPSLAFGTAIHAALEQFYQQLLTDQTTPSEGFLQDAFARAVQFELMTEHETARWKKHGQEVLHKFYQSQSVDASQVLFLERPVGRGKGAVVVGGKVPIKGRFDRVDWVDTSAGTVKVIDYKTGEARSENYILGKTASQPKSERELQLPVELQGKFYRQLLFYKLLADLDPTFKPTVTKGEFIFVEASKSRSFELEDPKMMAELIVEIDQEVRTNLSW